MATLCCVCGFDRSSIDALTCGKRSCIDALEGAQRTYELERVAKPFDTAAPVACSWCGRPTLDSVELYGMRHPICEDCSRGPEDN